MMVAPTGRRIPDSTERRRLECPNSNCTKLLCRFSPGVTGGPIEFKCPQGHVHDVYFNTAGPEWDIG